MSRSDLVRCLEDLKSRADLERELERLGEDPERWTEWARIHGYDLTPDEVRRLERSRRELSDDDLDQVAGGWDGGTSGGEP